MNRYLVLWLSVFGLTALLWASVGPGKAVGDTFGYADVVLEFFDSGAGPIPGPYGIIQRDGIWDGPVPVSLDVVLGRDVVGAKDVLSLPTGSFVVVGFTDEVINDGPGFDLLVKELQGSEPADVFASSDLNNFVFLGTAAGTTAFDLAGTGLSDPVQAVKVVGLDAGGRSPGFDLLNVQVLQSPTHAGPLTDGLIGYWQFDGNGRDASGGGRDLQLVGGVGFAEGLFGRALDLHNDPTQYAQRLVDDAVYDFGSEDFTVQAWVNFNDTSREQVLVEKFDGSGGPGWTLTQQGQANNVWHFWTRPGPTAWSETQSIDPAVWHQVLARRHGDVLEVLYDGICVAVDSEPDPVPDTEQPLLIGKRNEFDGRDFPTDGRIDEVAIWNRALTDGEIAILYNSGNGTPIPEPSTAVLAVMGCLSLLIFGCRRRLLNRKR